MIGDGKILKLTSVFRLDVVRLVSSGRYANLLVCGYQGYDKNS